MTRRLLNRLTALEVQHLSKPGKYADGGGLNLIVGTRGQKRWAYIYTRHGRRFELGLGAARDVPLATARAQAAEYREALAADKDPRSLRQAADRRITFGDYAAEYLETMAPTWRNPKHAQQWVMTVTKYAAPLHKKLIHEIVTDDVEQPFGPCKHGRNSMPLPRPPVTPLATISYGGTTEYFQGETKKGAGATRLPIGSAGRGARIARGTIR